MKALLFSPHGFARQEGGLALAVLGYLRPQMQELKQVTCQGLFSQCGRDRAVDTSGGAELRRPLGQCFECQGEQQFMAEWLESDTLDLGAYLSSEDIRASAEFVSKIEDDQLHSFELQGLPLSLVLRSAPARSALMVAGQRGIRSELLDALRFLNAIDSMLLDVNPDVIFATGLDDFMNVLLEGAARRLRIQHLRFRSGPEQRASELLDTRTGKVASSELLLRHLGFIPNHNDEWPEGLKNHIEELLMSLGLLDPQLSLQLDAVGS